MMRQYDEAMEALRFSEDFCERTVEKLDRHPQRRRISLPGKVLAVAACTLLSAALLFGTVWAASPEFRTLFLPHWRIGTIEQATLPEEPGSVTVNKLGPVTAQYYKLDGTFANHGGIAGFIPVEKDGITTIYRINEDDELIEAEPSRHIQRQVDYAGQHWNIDFLIYEEGNVAFGLTPSGDQQYLIDADSLTLWINQGELHRPIYLTLSTGAIDDPAEKIDFTLPEGAASAYLSTMKGCKTALISCRINDDSDLFYRADLETGAVQKIASQSLKGDGVVYQEILYYNGQIYSNANHRLSVLRDGGEWECLLQEGERSNYRYGEKYALVDNHALGELYLLDVETQERLLLSDVDGALDITGEILYNPSHTLLAVNAYCLTSGSLGTKTIAVIDPVNRQMVTLERVPGVQEVMAGWMDDTRFEIGGGDALCVYTIDFSEVGN